MGSHFCDTMYEGLTKIQWNAEIRTSLDFGQSTFVPLFVLFEGSNVQNPYFFLLVYTVYKKNYDTQMEKRSMLAGLV